MDWSVTDSVVGYLIITASLSIIISVISIILLFISYCYIKSRAAKVKSSQPESEISVGFFHPYCNAGGGGRH